jgi:holo-[acyl-carrier protein] synthase
MTSGSVIAIGTDIIECERISQMMEKHGDAFLKRVFTAGEIEYCVDRKMAYQHFAGRWAAKEAVLKTLGTGWGQGVQWTDVEVIRPAGAPSIALYGRALEVAQQLHIARVLISISHTKDYAVAFATALGGG